MGSACAKIKGKEEIDILIITNNIPKTYESLRTIGFSKGPIQEDEAHMRNRDYGIMCDMHIFEKEHEQVQRYLEQSDKLKNNSKIREEYIKLKEESLGLSMQEYKDKKKEFWKNVQNI